MSDRIECSVGLAMPNQIDMDNTVSVGDFTIAGEAIEDKSETLIAFHIAGTLEEFIQHRTD